MMTVNMNCDKSVLLRSTSDHALAAYLCGAQAELQHVGHYGCGKVGESVSLSD